mgnify:CR=1 FL=1
MVPARRRVVVVIGLLFAEVAPAVAADHDDETLSRLVTANARALTGIPGCHRMEGRFTVHADFGILGGDDTDWLVRGTLRDGVWGDRQVADPARPTEWHAAGRNAVSAFGVDPALPEGTGWGPLLLRALPGQVSMQHAERRGAQWALVSTLDGGPRSTNAMFTLFDDDPLAVRAIEVRVSSPIRAIVDGGHPIRILRLTMDLVLDEAGVPVSEAFDARFAQGLASGTSRLWAGWQARPCDS